MLVESRYFYAGRQVVNLAGTRTVDEHAIGWISEGAWDFTLAQLLGRVNLALFDVIAPARGVGLPVEGPIGWHAMPALDRFLRIPSVAEKILVAAKEARDSFFPYMRASGLMDGTPCAVVDVGWKGRVFNSICNILGDEHSANHVALYFGLYSKPTPPAGRGQEGFLFDLHTSTRLRGGPRHP